MWESYQYFTMFFKPIWFQDCKKLKKFESHYGFFSYHQVDLAHPTALFCPILVCPQKANMGFQILAYFSSIYKTRKMVPNTRKTFYGVSWQYRFFLNFSWMFLNPNIFFQFEFWLFWFFRHEKPPGISLKSIMLPEILLTFHCLNKLF